MRAVILNSGKSPAVRAYRNDFCLAGRANGFLCTDDFAAFGASVQRENLFQSFDAAA